MLYVVVRRRVSRLFSFMTLILLLCASFVRVDDVVVVGVYLSGSAIGVLSSLSAYCLR